MRDNTMPVERRQNPVARLLELGQRREVGGATSILTRLQEAISARFARAGTRLEEVPDELPEKRVLVFSPVNSGSSFFQELMAINGNLAAEETIRSKLFKHYFPTLVEAIIRKEAIDCSKYIFVVLVRDPRQWLESTLLSQYELIFDSINGTCRVNLTAKNHGLSYRRSLEAMGLDVNEWETALTFDNIFAYWHLYYKGFLEFHKNYNVYFVKYEDLLFNSAAVIHNIATAAGLTDLATVSIPMRPSKSHGAPSGYLGARDKYLAQLKRSNGIERDSITGMFDPSMLQILGYPYLGADVVVNSR